MNPTPCLYCGLPASQPDKLCEECRELKKIVESKPNVAAQVIARIDLGVVCSCGHFSDDPRHHPDTGQAIWLCEECYKKASRQAQEEFARLCDSYDRFMEAQ